MKETNKQTKKSQMRFFNISYVGEQMDMSLDWEKDPSHLTCVSSGFIIIMLLQTILTKTENLF